MDEGGFILDYLMPAGSSLEDTNAVLLQVEKILKKTPEVELTSRRTGLQLGLAAVTEANQGDFSVKLKRKRSRPIEEVIKAIRKEVTEKLPQLDVEFIQVLQDQIGDLTSSPEPIEVKLFSQDPELLKKWAPKLGEKLKKTKGIADVKDGIENTISGSAIVMKVDPIAAARSGFTPQEIEIDASAILQGEPATTPVVVNDRSYTIRVRFPSDAHATLDQIRNTLITSNSTGKTATLGTLADFQNEVGQIEIRRENLQRYVAVTGRFEGMSLGQGIEIVKGVVADLQLPPEIRVVYGGTYAEQQKSFQDLLMVLGVAVVLVFTVLLFEFRTFAAPTAIIASALTLLSTFRSISRPADHENVLQYFIVHGTHHGDRHRREKRHLAARCGSTLSRRRNVGPRGNAGGGRPPLAADSDDRAGHHRWHDSLVVGHRRGIADAATARDRCHWRHRGIDGSLAHRHAGRALLFKRPQGR